MSVEYLRLIPTDPEFRPDAKARTRARRALRTALPRAGGVTDQLLDEIAFWDAGEKPKSASCPHCGKALPSKWWRDAMHAAWKSGFKKLKVKVPCCQKPTSLNDLAYDWPTGFSCYVLEACDPGLGKELPAETVGKLEIILGCPLRQCRARY